MREDFLPPLNLSALARYIGVPPNRISAIAAGRRGVTGDTALRFAAAFATTPEFRQTLRKRWELETARDTAPDLAIKPVAA